MPFGMNEYEYGISKITDYYGVSVEDVEQMYKELQTNKPDAEQIYRWMISKGKVLVQ